jgi:ribosomal protein S12 methylthiotransferase accessory factor
MTNGPEITITFPSNLRVDADFGDFTVFTDQRRRGGGDESAPEPYDLFLASLGTCAGYYVLAFCRARDLPIEGISLVQRHAFNDPGHVLARVEIEIRVPPGFPEKYHRALIRAAETCGVKKAIQAGPEITVGLVTA